MALGVDDAVWVKMGVDLAKTAQKEGWLAELRGAFHRKNHVLLVGATGVGKSQALSALKDSETVIVDIARRTSQNQPGKKVKLGGSPFVFYDTPGDDVLDEERLKAYNSLEGRSNTGIINVVSFGTTNIRLRPKPSQKRKA